MNIDEKYFRDYHEVIGGEYKELWHEWMTYFDCNIINDTIKHVVMGERMDYNEIEYVKYSW